MSGTPKWGRVWEASPAKTKPRSGTWREREPEHSCRRQVRSCDILSLGFAIGRRRRAGGAAGESEEYFVQAGLGQGKIGDSDSGLREFGKGMGGAAGVGNARGECGRIGIRMQDIAENPGQQSFGIGASFRIVQAHPQNARSKGRFEFAGR